MKLATTPEEAAEKAEAILGLDIKGHIVGKVLVTPAADIAEEYYVSFLLDRANRTYLAMASVEGGMEIEQLAVERPEALAKIPVDAITGVDDAKAAEIGDAAGFAADIRDQVIDILKALWVVFIAEDATLVEVNPLVQHPRRPDRRPRRQGHPRRQRRLPPPRPRGARRQRRDRPARARGQGEGPELRQAATARSASSATAPAW